MKNIFIELIILAFIIVVALIVRRIFINKSDKIKKIPFIIITVILLLMEAAKQIYSLCTGYDLYFIPLQICSLFLLCYPVAVFAKGKVSAAGWCMSLCLGCSVTLAMVFLSQILTRDYIFKLFTPEATPFHYFTVLYHHLVVLHFVIMLCLVPYKPQKCDIRPSIIAYMCFMILSCIMANFLHTNFSGYINYGAAVFDYFKRFGQIVFNMVGFCLNVAEYLLGIGICFVGYSMLKNGRLRRETGDKS